MRVLCADIECDGLLPTLTKLHIFYAKDPDSGRTYEINNLKKLQAFLNKFKHVPLVMHNGICFDKPALEKLGVTVPNRIIDTLPISWFLYPNRHTHGLADWGEEFGVPKPPIDDWENLSYEEYKHRCVEDVEIQCKLWHRVFPILEDLYRLPGKQIIKGKVKETIYDGEVNTKKLNEFMKYLEFKMELQNHQQQARWKSDLGGCECLKSELEFEIQERIEELKLVMPEVPEYATYNRPKVMFKKNGELSANGIKWEQRLEQYAKEQTKRVMDLPNDLSQVTILKGYKEPNPNSVKQKKDWLDSLGWKPETWKYVKDKKEDPKTGKTIFEDRKIAQITAEEGELDPGIKKLLPTYPELKALQGLGILNHRLGIVNGFIANMSDDEYLIAGASGLTNTLRMKHRTLVNIPSARAKYGKEIRELLTCEEGEVLCGSDLSSLEDRLKHHFQMPLDPEYVKSQMSDDFDPHLLMCEEAGLLKPEEVIRYKELGKKDEDALTDIDKAFMKKVKKVRHSGKGTNYAAQYQAKAPTIARTAGVPIEVGEALYNAYWSINWSIKQIAEEQTVRTLGITKYQLNPINGFWYHLKTEKDRFSTLIQGSGAYIFDLWSGLALNIAKKRYGKAFPYLGQFHDELILRVKDSPKARKIVEDILKEAIQKVNELLKLNRDMDIDVCFGKTYADIH